MKRLIGCGLAAASLLYAPFELARVIITQSWPYYSSLGDRSIFGAELVLLATATYLTLRGLVRCVAQEIRRSR